MTITIADGRGALWQWDTGRRLRVGSGVEQVHYQNRVLGGTLDVDVGADGTAIIPDELLQDWHPLTAYAYVTDDTGAYTMVQQDFVVYKRAKPADYVYTPTEHAGFDRLCAEIGDLSALQTDAKDSLVAAINEAAASGGSAEVIKYTPQALTDEQKEQARKNIDAASDFVVNATLNLDRTAALDKTFGQMSEALAAGKNPIVHVRLGNENSYLKMSVYTTGFMVFTNIGMQDDGRFALAFALIVTNDGATYRESYLLAADGGQHLPQISMAADPTEDMQIATKKYVDDKECILQSTTAGSTKRFKITVDDSGTLAAVEVTE